MGEADGSEHRSADVLESLPVFPLPGVVLFPHIALPLRVFEPRYVAMVEDALQSHQMFAVTMLQNPEESMCAQPKLNEVACLSKIIHAEKISAKQHLIVVHGIERVTLKMELPLMRGYRRFRSVALPTPSPEELVFASEQWSILQSLMGHLKCAYAADTPIGQALHANDTPLETVDILSGVLIQDPLQRQKLLSTLCLKTRIQFLNEVLSEVLVQAHQPEGLPN